MRRILYALVLAGAFIIPASAQAQELPPGTTTGAEFLDAPMPYAMKDCAHGRAKLLRWHLQDYRGVIAKHSLKLAVCARDGHVYWFNTVHRRWSDSDSRWSSNAALQNSGGACCRGGRQAHSTSLWVFHGVIDQYWQSDLNIKAHVGGPGRGPNDVWFSKWSRFE